MMKLSFGQMLLLLIVLLVLAWTVNPDFLTPPTEPIPPVPEFIHIPLPHITNAEFDMVEEEVRNLGMEFEQIKIHQIMNSGLIVGEFNFTNLWTTKNETVGIWVPKEVEIYARCIINLKNEYGQEGKVCITVQNYSGDVTVINNAPKYVLYLRKLQNQKSS